MNSFLLETRISRGQSDCFQESSRFQDKRPHKDVKEGLCAISKVQTGECIEHSPSRLFRCRRNRTLRYRKHSAHVISMDLQPLQFVRMTTSTVQLLSTAVSPAITHEGCCPQGSSHEGDLLEERLYLPQAFLDSDNFPWSAILEWKKVRQMLVHLRGWLLNLCMVLRKFPRNVRPAWDLQPDITAIIECRLPLDKGLPVSKSGTWKF